MRYKELIKKYKPVSVIGLGAWQLGINSGWKNVSEKDALKQVHSAIEMGVNFFDTAPNYGLGSSEIRLGKALKSHNRDKIVINTKFGHSDSGELNFEASEIRKSLDGSLKRLQMDYVDSLLLHNPPTQYLDGNQNDHYEILERLKEEGKIRAYGASLDRSEEMNLLMETTQAEIIEALFNILHQDVAQSFDLAQKKGVGIIAKIPLDSGWLGGKYTKDSRFDDIRSRWTVGDIHLRASLVEELKEIIGPENILSEIALAFCLSFDAISTVITGNTRLEQLQSNIKSTKHSLPDDLVHRLVQFYKERVQPLALPW